MRTILALVILAILSCNSKEKTAAADEWKLTERNVYEYRLDNRGRTDTMFVRTYKYNDMVLSDSSLRFVTSKYTGDLPLEEVHYTVGKNGTPTVAFKVNYGFTKQGFRQWLRYEKGGQILRDELYMYGDSNRLKTFVYAQNKALPEFSETAFANYQPATSGTPKFDTIQSVYKYDSTKKVIGTINADARGNTITKNINIYTGEQPFASYLVNHKGDTIERTQYESRGKIVNMKTETDSMLMVQMTNYGFVLDQYTTFKSRGEKWRTSFSYDEKGRRIEDKTYVSKRQ